MVAGSVVDDVASAAIRKRQRTWWSEGLLYNFEEKKCVERLSSTSWYVHGTNGDKTKM